MHYFFSFLKQHVVIILLFCILVSGGYLRIQNLGEQSLWIDEGYSINAAHQVLKHGKPLLESGQMYTNQLFTSYSIAGSIAIFGFDPYNPWSARLPSVLFGIANILLVFFFTRRLFDDDWVALGSAFFVAFFPWEIAWARQARGYTMLQFFLLLSFDHLLAFIQEKKVFHAVLGSIAMIFAYFSHGLAVAFVPGFFLTLGIWMFLGIETISLKKSIPFFILCFIAIIIGQSWLENLDIVNYLHQYNAFLWQYAPWLISISVAGFFVALFQKRSIISGVLLLSITSVAYVIIASYGNTLQYRYLVALVPFIGIGVIYFFYFVSHGIVVIIKKPMLHYIASPVAVIGCIIFLITTQHISFTSTSKLDTTSPQPDFVGAYTYIQENKETWQHIISPYAHMTNIYLGEPGILLPISLTGKSNEFNLTITPHSTDYYTNAEIVYSDAILDYIQKHSGYIVIDTMAQNRIPSVFLELRKNTMLVFQSQSKTGSIWVFRF